MTDPGRRLSPVVRVAPAKLNLTLAVVGRYADGYHALHTVMVPLGLADRLTVAPLVAGEDTLHVEGFDPGPHAENLALRAVAAARRAVGRAGPTPPLAIRLDKRIPVAAGLAGGSSDAAAALDAALEAWGVELDPARRQEVALSLGSDVPFFLAAGPALVEGRGERVTPLPAPADEPPGVVLVTPAIAVQTGAVFGLFDAAAAARGGRGDGSVRLTSEHLAGELRAGLGGAQLVARAGVLAAANDLTAAAAALVPDLVPFRRALARLLRRPIGMSGSGATHWALYPSLHEAQVAAVTLDDAIAAGRLPAPGDDRPFVAATTLGFGRTAPAGEEGATVGSMGQGA